MHIALVCEEYPPAPHGGTGSSYRDLADGLTSAGHRATVLGISTTKPISLTSDEYQEGVRVIRIPRAPQFLGTKWGGLFERLRLKAWLRRVHGEHRIGAVECSDYNGWLSWGGIRRVPTIVRIRGSNLFFDAELGRAPQVFEHKHERACLKKATRIASVSKYAADRTLGLCGLQKRECTVIPNAVDAAVFWPNPEVAVEPGLVVFVNSLNPKKGIEQLLDAINDVFATRPGARLVVIGEDTQRQLGGAYVEQLKERVRPFLRERVTFTGRLRRDDVVQWLQRASIVCLPSHMETFGIAALEAMAVGRPTVFTKLGPGPEIIEHEQTGLLCDPRDPREIAAALTRLLDDTPFAESLGKAARTRVLEQFDKRQWIPRNLAFYKEVVEQPQKK